ncbi:MAG: ABC transporter permease subunit [Alphaproteobacteria bacterium]
MARRGTLALAGLRLLTAAVCLWLFAVPGLVVIVSAFASDWVATVLPTRFTLRWFEHFDATDVDAMLTSFEVAGMVAALGTILGLWLAISLNPLEGRRLGGLLDAVIMVPNSVPSVVLGLAVLLAYHAPPLDISGSAAIVVLVQTALVMPFCYRMCAAALKQEIPVFREAAASLGAPPAMVLRRVILPLLEPAIRASVALAFAFSIGDLGATLMVYPPGFSTVPIVVIEDVERGFYYRASALALILLALSFASLVLVAGRGRRAKVAAVAMER